MGGGSRFHVCHADERTPLRCRGYLVLLCILLIKPVEAKSAGRPRCLRAARVKKFCLFRSARPPQLGLPPAIRLLGCPRLMTLSLPLVGWGEAGVGPRLVLPRKRQAGENTPSYLLPLFL